MPHETFNEYSERIDQSKMHTPEPWSYCEDNDGWRLENGVEQHGRSMSEANARRIVSCVNACAGAENGVLELFPYQEQVDLKVKFFNERNELLEALKYHQDQTRPIQRTIDLIAKCENS